MALAPTRQPYRFTVEEYLAFERASEERHEYLDGVIYAMAGSASTQAMAGESEDHDPRGGAIVHLLRGAGEAHGRQFLPGVSPLAARPAPGHVRALRVFPHRRRSQR